MSIVGLHCGREWSRTSLHDGLWILCMSLVTSYMSTKEFFCFCKWRTRITHQSARHSNKKKRNIIIAADWQTENWSIIWPTAVQCVHFIRRGVKCNISAWLILAGSLAQVASISGSSRSIVFVNQHMSQSNEHTFIARQRWSVCSFCNYEIQ